MVRVGLLFLTLGGVCCLDSAGLPEVEKLSDVSLRICTPKDNAKQNNPLPDEDKLTWLVFVHFCLIKFHFRIPIMRTSQFC